MNTLITGVAIKDPIDNAIFSLERPHRHHHVIHLMIQQGRPKPIRGEQGFILQDGTFVNREEGAKIALSNGQCKQLKFNNKRLFSEDLW